MESTRFQFLKQVMTPAFSGLCGGDDAHKNYLENIVKLCNYVKSVNHTKLPALSYPFENWDEYAQVFVSVKAQSLTWTDNVLGKLVNVPDRIIARDKDVCKLFESIIENCANLANNPDTPNLKKRVLKDLRYCLEDIDYVCGLIERLIDELSRFNNSLEKQTEELKQLADTSLEAEKTDRIKIEELKTAMERTKRNIDQLTDSVIGLSVGLTICLAVGIGIAFAGPDGYIGSIFVSIIAGADLAILAYDAADLVAEKTLTYWKRE